MNGLTTIAKEIITSPLFRHELKHVINRMEEAEKDKLHVYESYGKKFRVISSLSEEEVVNLIREFLVFENNKHWMSLQRNAKRLIRNPKKLKKVIETLLDENLELEKKNRICQKFKNRDGKSYSFCYSSRCLSR